MRIFQEVGSSGQGSHGRIRAASLRLLLYLQHRGDDLCRLENTASEETSLERLEQLKEGGRQDS